jgi:hypothetical protein
MNPSSILAGFDRFLMERGLHLDAIIVGGAALNLLGVISRPTKDCDVLWPHLPEEIAAAASAFAAAMRRQGEPLADDWLNNGPASLVAQLPADWRNHLRLAFVGVALRLHVPGREDLLRSKLFALCDRGIDLADCIALAPTIGDLAALRPWLDRQDGNPDWPAHVGEVLDDLRTRLGHGV